MRPDKGEAPQHRVELTISMDTARLLWDAFYAAASSSENEGNVERAAIAEKLLSDATAVKLFGRPQLDQFKSLGGQISWAELENGLVSGAQVAECEAMHEELELMTPRSPVTNLKPEAILDRIGRAKIILGVPEDGTASAIADRCQFLVAEGRASVFVVEGGSCPTSLEIIKILRSKGLFVGSKDVMGDEVEVAHVAEAGAHFCVSPVEPGSEFVNACQAHDMLAIPSVSTPSELWRAHKAGALLVRLDPCGVWEPEGLTGLAPPLRVIPKLATDLKGDRTGQWLDAGATAVMHGTELVGKDGTTREGKVYSAWQKILTNNTSNQSLSTQRGAQTARVAERPQQQVLGSQTARLHEPRIGLREAKPNIPLNNAIVSNVPKAVRRSAFQAAPGPPQGANSTLSRLGAKKDVESTRKTIDSIRDRLKAL